MEFGDPPLYSEVNKLAREGYKTNKKDKKPHNPHLMRLGPFAKAVLEVTHGAEANRKLYDKLKLGKGYA
jgi:hypothetical protein